MSPMTSHRAASTFPGPVSQAMLEELGQYVVSEPYPFVLDLEKCNGMTLVTVDGQELFDWAGYYGSKLIGHNHPGLYEPSYLKRLQIAANNKVANPDFLTRECLDFYRMVHQNAPEVMRSDSLECYVINSGAEAVENMMKYMISRFNTRAMKEGRMVQNRRFLYFDKAFHGRTVFALGVTQTIDPVATKDFHGLSATGNIKLPFPSVGSAFTEREQIRMTDEALKMVEMALTQMKGEVVGIITEPIQGAGGQRCARPEFFRGLSELAHEHGTYVAYDEVQTGFGATGKMFAIDHFNLPFAPIAVASGKKFGSGILYMAEPLEEVGVLDSTWGGTLADMVRVVREMEIVQSEGLIEAAAVKGERLAAGLLSLAARFPKVIQNVRGMGLYQGFELPNGEMKGEFVRKAREEFGLLLLGAGRRSVRTRPNLSVAEADIDRLVEILGEIAGTF